jgi:elongation factor Ts
MTNIEKVKHVREVTMASMNKISDALLAANGNVSEAIAILVKEKQTSAEDMANRRADNSIVYSYVHNNKIGAMIILASQTDFVAKNELFVDLAKNICMHIVSSPVQAQYIDISYLLPEELEQLRNKFASEVQGKPQNIIDKIVDGKIKKYLEESCLLNQPFVKDDNLTIRDIINNVSANVGEKIELKKFVRFSA